MRKTWIFFQYSLHHHHKRNKRVKQFNLFQIFVTALFSSSQNFFDAKQTKRVINANSESRDSHLPGKKSLPVCQTVSFFNSSKETARGSWPAALH